jgi:hypothetical protein
MKKEQIEGYGVLRFCNNEMLEKGGGGFRSGSAAFAVYNLKEILRCKLAAGAAGCNILDNRKLYRTGGLM